MAYFVLFVIGAVMLGAGAMLAPAWPTKQPRIGLAASFALALVVGGAVWWTELFAWDTLVIDYLLFALVSGVILGGTMAQAQTRAQARGEELADSEMGWTGPEDLAFFGLVLLFCAMPLFVLNLPLGTQAASDVLISSSIKEAGTFSSFAELEIFVAPGFYALAAYLSQQLRQPIPTIHMALGSVIAFLSVWTVYDLGSELRDKRLGRAMAIAMLLASGLSFLLWQSHYQQLMAILFALAFISYVLRYYRQQQLIDMLAAGLLLGAVLYLSPILFLIALLTYYLFLFLTLLPSHRKIAPKPILSYLGLWLGVLSVCIFGIAPWAFKTTNWSFIFADKQEIMLIGIYTIFLCLAGGYALLWIFEKLPLNLQKLSRRYAYALMFLSLLIILGMSFYLRELFS